MTPLAEGLRISILGLALVFAALGLLILLLVILQRVSNWLLDSDTRRREPAPAREEAGQGGEREREELARAAAVAVAVVLMKARASAARDGSLGELLQQPAYAWWRPNEMASVTAKERDAG